MVLLDRVVRHLTVVTPRESCVLARTGGPARPSPTRDDGGAMRAAGAEANDSPAAVAGRDSLAEHLDGEGVLCVRRQPAFETAATFEPLSHRNRRGYAGGRSEPPRGRLAMMSTVQLFDPRPARCRKSGRPGGLHHLRPNPPSRRAASVRRILGVLAPADGVVPAPRTHRGRAVILCPRRIRTRLPRIESNYDRPREAAWEDGMTAANERRRVSVRPCVGRRVAVASTGVEERRVDTSSRSRCSGGLYGPDGSERWGGRGFWSRVYQI